MPNNASHGSVTVEIKTDNRQVMHILERLDNTLDPTRVAVWLEATVEPWFRQRASDRFQNEGDDVTGPWAPLKDSTNTFRRNDPQGPFPPDHPINRRTGRLEAYITGSNGRAVPHALGATLTMPGKRPSGELKKKVTTAQAGKDYPKTVARPVLGMNERDLLAVLTDLSLYVSVGQFV